MMIDPSSEQPVPVLAVAIKPKEGKIFEHIFFFTDMFSAMISCTIYSFHGVSMTQ